MGRARPGLSSFCLTTIQGHDGVTHFHIHEVPTWTTVAWPLCRTMTRATAHRVRLRCGTPGDGVMEGYPVTCLWCARLR